MDNVSHYLAIATWYRNQGTALDVIMAEIAMDCAFYHVRRQLGGK